MARPRSARFALVVGFRAHLVSWAQPFSPWAKPSVLAWAQPFTLSLWAKPCSVLEKTGWHFVTSAHFAASCTTDWVAHSRNESWFGSPALKPHVGEHVLVTPQFLAVLNQPSRAQDGGVLRPKAINP